jgi:hypothetical protein
MQTKVKSSVARRYYEEVLNKRNLDLLQELAVSDYVENDPLPGQGAGREGLGQRVEMIQGAFGPEEGRA